MSVKLSPQQHDQIFNILKRSFSDFALFDSLVAVKLRQALIDSNSIEINEKSTKRVVERYFAVDAFKSPEQKALIYPLELIFQACYVLVISHRESSKATQWRDVDTLLRHYPQFARDVDADELQYLLNYRNVVKIALSIIPARLNKGRLLQIGGKLEGSHNEYITGSGQKIEVIRRTDVYHQEGKIKIVLKKPRVKHSIAPAPVTFSDPSMSPSVVTSDDESSPPQQQQSLEKRKRKRATTVITCTSSSFSHTKLKMMKLPVEDLDTLLNGKGSDFSATAVQQRPYLPSRSGPMVLSADIKKDASSPAVWPTPRRTNPNTGSHLSLQSLVDLPTESLHHRGTSSPAVSYLDAATIRVADSYFGGDSDFYPLSYPPYNPSSSLSSAPSVPYMARDTTYDLMLNCSLLSNASEFWGGDLEEGDDRAVNDLLAVSAAAAPAAVISQESFVPVPAMPTLSRSLSSVSLSLMDLSGLDDDCCCEDEDLLFGGPVLMGDLLPTTADVVEAC
eukprot:gene30026-37173_t